MKNDIVKQDLDVESVEVDYYIGHGRMMVDFHMHSYYELSFVMQGDLSVLFDHDIHRLNGSGLILSRPYTNHYILHESDAVYERCNILFTSSSFLGSTISEQRVAALFKKHGNFIPVSEEKCEKLSSLVKEIREEEDAECRKMLLMLMVRRITKLDCNRPAIDEGNSYHYIGGVLKYISENYSMNLTAARIAEKFFVSRTKLMTDFKSMTGLTLCSHITSIRVDKAKEMLRNGVSITDTTMKCGFVNTCNFIRVFKKKTELTPKQYIDMN